AQKSADRSPPTTSPSSFHVEPTLSDPPSTSAGASTASRSVPLRDAQKAPPGRDRRLHQARSTRNARSRTAEYQRRRVDRLSAASPPRDAQKSAGRSGPTTSPSSFHSERTLSGARAPA